jgi:hypothetical protein
LKIIAQTKAGTFVTLARIEQSPLFFALKKDK